MQRSDLSEEEILRLYQSGGLERTSQCRPTGSAMWQKLEDCLTLPKRSGRAFARTEQVIDATIVGEERRTGYCGTDDDGKPARTPALQVGWASLGIALLAVWFLQPLYPLFPLAIAGGAVAMATKQKKKGLLLVGVSSAAAVLWLIVAASLRHAPFQRRPAAEVAVFPAPAAPSPTPAPPAFTTSVKPRANLDPTPRLAPPLPVATPIRIVSHPDPTPALTPSLPAVHTIVTGPAHMEATPRPVASMSPREIFDEIALLEKERATWRQQNRDLPAVSQQRLRALWEAQK